MCFVCSLCFAGVHIPMCAYGVVLCWEHGEGAHIMSESDPLGNHLRYVRNIQRTRSLNHERFRSVENWLRSYC